MSAVAQPGMSEKRAGARAKSDGGGVIGGWVGVTGGAVIGGRGGMGVRLPATTGAGRVEAQPARMAARLAARMAR